MVFLCLPSLCHAGWTLDNCSWKSTTFPNTDITSITICSDQYIISGGCYQEDMVATTAKEITVWGGVTGPVTKRNSFKCDYSNETTTGPEPIKRISMLCCGVPSYNDNAVELTSGNQRNNLSSSQGNWRYYKFEAGENDYKATLSLWSSQNIGDADLYVQRGVLPDRNNYLCRSIQSSNNETCVLNELENSTYFVGVYAYNTYSNVSIQSDLYLLQTDSVRNIESDDENKNINASQGEWRYFKILVTEDDESLNINTTNSMYGEDVDLYVRYRYKPTFQWSDCRSTSPSNDESCNINFLQPGDYYIGLYAYYGFSSVNLTASVVSSDIEDQEDDLGNQCNEPSWNPSTFYYQGDIVSHLGNVWEVTYYFASPGWEPGDHVLWDVWDMIGTC